MNASTRGLFRTIFCISFVASLYGGMILLTAALFAKGFIMFAVISGLVLSLMTAMALGLFGLAWAMTAYAPEEDQPEYVAQMG